MVLRFARAFSFIRFTRRCKRRGGRHKKRCTSPPVKIFGILNPVTGRLQPIVNILLSAALCQLSPLNLRNMINAEIRMFLLC